MSNRINTIDQHQLLKRLHRNNSQETHETSVVTSPGGQATALAIKIKSLSSYNIYNVRAVSVGAAGSIPVEIGEEIEAFNVAERVLIGLTTDRFVIRMGKSPPVDVYHLYSKDDHCRQHLG